jgi:hypothetical protein
MRVWQRGIIPGRVVNALVFDETDPGGGPFIGSSAGWYRVPPGGIRGGALATAAAARRPAPRRGRASRQPRVAGQRRADPQRWTWTRRRAYTSARAGRGTASGWYIGTAGNGLMYLQPGAAVPQRLPYGLIGDRVGRALRGCPAAVWVATDRHGVRRTRAQLRGQRLQPLRYVAAARRCSGWAIQQVRRIVSHERALWLATDEGVVRVEGHRRRAGARGHGRGFARFARVHAALPPRLLFAGTRAGRRAHQRLAACRAAWPARFSGEVLSLEQDRRHALVGTTDGVLMVPPDAVGGRSHAGAH